MNFPIYEENLAELGEKFEQHVKLLEKGINRDVDPSENFFQFANGNFKIDDFDEKRGEYHPSEYRTSYDCVFNDQNIQCDLMTKVRDFHSSLPTNARELLENEEIAAYCGGFPAFKEDWNADDFDWIKAAGILNAFYSPPILFAFNSYLDNRKIVTLCTEHDVTGEDGEIGENKLRELNIAEDKIFDIINDANVILESLKRMQVDDEDVLNETERRSLNDLRDHPFDFIKFCETATGETITEDDSFHLSAPGEGFFDRFLNIFIEASPKTVANFITFRVAVQFGTISWPLTLSSFTPILVSLAYETYVNPSGKKIRETVLEKFTKSSKKIYSDLNWEEGEEYLEIVPTNGKEIYDYLEEHFNREKIQNEYAELEIDPTNFFHTLMTLRGLGPTPSSKLQHSYRSEDTSKYNEAMSILDFFCQYYRQPVVSIFAYWIDGCWRTAIENHIIDEDYASEMNLLKTQCYKREKDVEDDSQDYILGLFIKYVKALELTIKDFQTWMQEHPAEVEIYNKIAAKSDLNIMQVFFITYMQRFRLPEQHADHYVLPLKNSDEFARAFNCPPDSVMNPREKCRVELKRKESRQEEPAES